MINLLKQAIKHWAYVEPLVRIPKNKDEYNQLAESLDQLVIMVGDDEAHPLIGLIDMMSDALDAYEVQKIEIPSKGIDALKFLMTSFHFTQKDLADIASQGVISEILNGKRKMSFSVIKKLAKKFDVSINTFIDD